VVREIEEREEKISYGMWHKIVHYLYVMKPTPKWMCVKQYYYPLDEHLGYYRVGNFVIAVKYPRQNYWEIRIKCDYLNGIGILYYQWVDHDCAPGVHGMKRKREVIAAFREVMGDLIDEQIEIQEEKNQYRDDAHKALFDMTFGMVK